MILGLLGFTLSVALLSAGLSLLISPWLDLPFWKIFRRCASLSAVICLWFFAHRAQHLTWRDLGLGPWRAGKRELVTGIVLGLVTIAVVIVGYAASGVIRFDLHDDRWRVARTVSTGIPAMLAVGALEEVIFRGYVLGQLRACSQGLAVGLSSLAYAVVHLKPAMVWPWTAFELIGLTVLGWVLAISTLRTNQLYLAIGLHAALAYAARVNKLFIEIPDSPMQWLVGTSRLINGAAVWAALGMLGLYILWRVKPQA